MVLVFLVAMFGYDFRLRGQIKELEGALDEGKLHGAELRK